MDTSTFVILAMLVVVVLYWPFTAIGGRKD